MWVHLGKLPKYREGLCPALALNLKKAWRGLALLSDCHVVTVIWACSACLAALTMTGRKAWLRVSLVLSFLGVLIPWVGGLCLPLVLLTWWCFLWRGSPHLCLRTFKQQSGVYTPGWFIQAVSWSSESRGRGDLLSWVETEAVLCFLVCWWVSSPWDLFPCMTFQTPLQQIAVKCVLQAFAAGV